MLSSFRRYTRCPDEYLDAGLTGALGDKIGFFAFGKELTLYGRNSANRVFGQVLSGLPDVADLVHARDGAVSLPFHPTDVVDNLRLERFVCRKKHAPSHADNARATVRAIYYFLRPLLAVGMRKHLQRLALRGWQDVPFPAWPVDLTVDRLHAAVWSMLMDAHDVDRLPFIWYWPDGRKAACILTHDVETRAGRDFCAEVIRLEAGFDMHSSFQVVPEKRYSVSQGFIDVIKGSGCELCIHGLNHDGRLFLEETEFRRRAVIINGYAQRWGCRGFRSPVMYRNPEWYDALDFSYDMSFPNTARLDPQRGGCCTAFPYFIGSLLELPLTTIQDYSLFHMLGRCDLVTWVEQMGVIAKNNGLISFIIHPDYAIPERYSALYSRLLGELHRRRTEDGLWVALPGEVDRWWRLRDRMSLVRTGDRAWTIEGEGADRARVAWAIRTDGGVRYVLGDGAPGREIGVRRELGGPLAAGSRRPREES